jgi:hypothetical protein
MTLDLGFGKAETTDEQGNADATKAHKGHKRESGRGVEQEITEGTESRNCGRNMGAEKYSQQEQEIFT